MSDTPPVPLDASRLEVLLEQVGLDLDKDRKDALLPVATMVFELVSGLGEIGAHSDFPATSFDASWENSK